MTLPALLVLLLASGTSQATGQATTSNDAATATSSIDFFASPPPKASIMATTSRLAFADNRIQEPHLRQETFDIMYRTDNKSALAPGYIFMTPFFPHSKPFGAQIYDMDGNLVFHAGPRRRTQDLSVCDYQGEIGNHLCMHDRTRLETKAIWDNTYSVVHAHHTGIQDDSPNGHEMNMLSGGLSYLQTAVARKTVDFSDNPHQEQQGTTIIDGCFQEVDSKTGKSLFDWCGADHVNLWDTDVYMNVPDQENKTSQKAGEGTKEKPWDYFHINSVDKYDGDYIVSSRYLDQLIKVAGSNNNHAVEPGTILWRLGGKTNDFTYNFTFSKQHAIRVLNFTSSETTVSILDNAWEGNIEPTANQSSGKIITINNETMTATLLQVYPHPQGMLAEGQGGTQVLPNGNMFVGWGRLPDVSEHAEDGTLLYYARFGTRNNIRKIQFNTFTRKNGHRDENSYRSVKFPWIGHPKTKPKLVLLRREAGAKSGCTVSAYMSWNGATEVKSWRVSSAGSPKGPWLHSKVIRKSGFETKTCINEASRGFNVFRMAFTVLTEALDKDGKVLGFRTARYNFALFALKRLACLVLFIELANFLYALACWILGNGSVDVDAPEGYDKVQMEVKSDEPGRPDSIEFELEDSSH